MYSEEISEKEQNVVFAESHQFNEHSKDNRNRLLISVHWRDSTNSQFLWCHSIKTIFHLSL
jgi:hypothetical protein